MKLKGWLIREAREDLGYTQSDVADALDLHLTTISNAENGKDMEVTTVALLCRFLNLDIPRTRIREVRTDEHPDGRMMISVNGE